MLIRKNEITDLSGDIRKIIDGQELDLRENREGVWGILKNDIHTLASLKNEQVEALEREHDMMRDTLTNIAHQIKTPLTSMMIMADLLEDAPPEKRGEFLLNIKSGLTRLEWLASSLLKIAKLDAGAVEFSREHISSDAVVALALEPLQILLDINDQRVEIMGETGLFCDKRWTAEALTNLVKNASECSSSGSIIRITASMNPICKWISVTDGGEGIPTAKIAALFKRFENSQSGKGYGIGLPLALAIMRGQNGDIEVNGGGNGCGATFTLKFYK